MKLEVKDLHVSVEDKEILKGVSITFEQGKVIALMGPNGSGKSTLANAIMGNPKYKITSGQIILDGKDITFLPVNERAKLGLFLSFQYPSEIPGVTISSFLRTALNTQGKKLDVIQFRKLLDEKMNELDMDAQFKTRYVNQGFSGGEKKRMEILQLSILQPKYAILDETDSGLDVDALKIVCNGIIKIRNPEMSIILITHYNRILRYLEPDEVHIISEGKIVKSGGKELAKEIEENGFKEFV